MYGASNDGQEVPWPFSFELALMDETGWSWNELMQTPYPVVQVKAIQMAARNRAIKEKRAIDDADRKAKEAMSRLQGRR